MGRTHSVTGVALWVGIGPLLTRDPIELVAGLAICAVLPYGADLDHPNSTSSRALWGPLHKRAGKAVAAALGGHRMGAHSLWACLVAGLACWAAVLYLAPRSAVVLGLAGVLGWFGGVLGDMLTKQRVGFLYPLTRRRIGIPIFTTGKAGEVVFNIIQVALASWFGYVHFGGL